MVRLILSMVFLLFLSGCTVSDKDTTDKTSALLEHQIASSHAQLRPVNETPVFDSTEEMAAADFEIIDPKMHTIEHNTTLYNHIGVVIDEVFLVKEGVSELLARNIQPGSCVLAQWITTEQPPPDSDGFGYGESPYFILVMSGQEIPVTTARLVNNEIHEELRITSDEIAFFHEENIYYFSPQSNYLDREEKPNEYILQAQYLYLPKVRRWLRQREGQLLFAVYLKKEEILAYFPDYTGDIPWVTRAAVISCETVYFEDVRIEADDNRTVTEVRESDELRSFTPDDVIVIPVDHVWFPYIYFRYQDAQGNVRRQYVTDQQRDNNNGTITTHMLTLDDEYYKLVPVE